nr:unnamed protein product [Callosobruchus analis]
MKVIDYVKTGWPSQVAMELKPYYVKRNELSCEQNCLLKGTKVVIPEALRSHILELIHEDHIGIVRTKMLARSTLWWPNVNADIEKMINGCQVCQQSQNNQERFLMSWPKTENVFSRIHIDFFHVESKTFMLPKKGGQVVVKESEEFIKPPMFTVGEKVFVGKLGPYSKEKWKTGEIVKCISAITYLVRVDDQIV